MTVDLKAGKYLLICNVPGHYGAGMWTEFTVDP
ncbi:sulfocyanin-like copper-binding protein [Mesorhizobium sp. ORM6]